MSSSSTIPLVRAAVLEPFVEAARQVGVPVEKMLRSAGLPAEPVDDAEQLLPELPCWRFIQLVTRKEGIPDFGLLAGNTITHQDLSALAPLIAGCTNLYDLLKRFCMLAPLFSNNNLYVLEEEEQFVWFTQQGARLVADDIQVQLFEVLGMIQLVQMAAGKNWRPADIHFSFEPQAELAYARDLNPSRIRFSRRHPSIAIPRQLLPLPIARFNAAQDATANAENLAPIPGTFSEGLRDAIVPYLGTGQLNKNHVAESIGLSPRTLHRRLAREHTCYSGVVEQARIMKAAAMLRERDANMLDISLTLDYQNASSFTRAFRRWAGVSPREYRYLHRAGKAFPVAPE